MQFNYGHPQTNSNPYIYYPIKHEKTGLRKDSSHDDPVMKLGDIKYSHTNTISLEQKVVNLEIALNATINRITDLEKTVRHLNSELEYNRGK